MWLSTFWGFTSNQNLNRILSYEKGPENRLGIELTVAVAMNTYISGANKGLIWLETKTIPSWKFSHTVGYLEAEIFWIGILWLLKFSYLCVVDKIN